MAESWGDSFYPVTGFPVRSLLFDDFELVQGSRWNYICAHTDRTWIDLCYSRLLEGDPTGDGVYGTEESRTATIDKDDGED